MFSIFKYFRRRAFHSDVDPLEIDSCVGAYLRRWSWGLVSARTKESLRTLIRCLTPQQRSDLLARNAFKVNGYVIECSGTTLNIYSDTVAATRYCAIPFAAHAKFDVYLVQKLWIEHREADFLRVAVKSPATRWE